MLISEMKIVTCAKSMKTFTAVMMIDFLFESFVVKRYLIIISNKEKEKKTYLTNENSMISLSKKIREDTK